MARKIQIQFIIKTLFLVAIGAIFNSAQGALSADQILVNFSFEDAELKPNRNNFSIFEIGKGSVRQSTRYHYSGYHSLEIIDTPGDKQFPELQGYFPLRENVKLYLRFSLLTTTPEESLNIALAGPAWFSLKKDGIGFWLSSKNGWIYHTTDSIPTKLFQIRGLVWYTFKIIYDVETGTYDIAVTEEGNSKPFVNLKKQWNAPHQPGSKVDKFSFIGDLGADDSAVSYYVDDILVGTDQKIDELPFKSQARKSLSFDGWHELKKVTGIKPQCPTIFEPSDLGIESSHLELLKSLGLIEALKESMLGNDKQIPTGITDPKIENLLKAINSWNLGCTSLKSGDTVAAENAFRLAMNHQPSAKMFPLVLALSLAAQSKWSEVDEITQSIYPQWANDPRFDMALAVMGLMHQNLKISAKVLEKFSPQIVNDLKDTLVQKIWQGISDRSILNEVKIKYPLRWKEIIAAPQVAEKYFYVLLWQGQFDQAYAYADKIYTQLKKMSGTAGVWGIFSGDALVFDNKLTGAIARYTQSLAEQNSNDELVLLGRLADVYAKLGDLENEKKIRTKIDSL